MSVKELINRLREYGPDAEVRVRAACCSHPHPIQAVRPVGRDDYRDDDLDAERTVILDAEE